MQEEQNGSLEEEQEEIITELKVKADPKDIAPEDRKKNVKKLAGAIAHALRSNGEINVRCFGAAAIGKAAKGLAIAQRFIGVQNLRLECSPAFITTKVNGEHGETELTGICFYTFASKKDEDEEPIDVDSVESQLWVKADAKDIDGEERRRLVRKLAGAIAHALEENKEVCIRCFGNATIGKAAKALAIARGFVAPRGPDLYTYPNFIVQEISGKERTGISYYVYTND